LIPPELLIKDTETYCNILLDKNSRQPIVRLHFNNAETKKLEIFLINVDGKKVSEKFSITDLKEIYQYTEKFRSIVKSYEQPKVS
jgi:hypothetical protein